MHSKHQSPFTHLSCLANEKAECCPGGFVFFLSPFVFSSPGVFRNYVPAPYSNLVPFHTRETELPKVRHLTSGVRCNQSQDWLLNLRGLSNYAATDMFCSPRRLQSRCQVSPDVVAMLKCCGVDVCGCYCPGMRRRVLGGTKKSRKC